MSIKIIDEPDLHLTRAEHDRLMHEYNQAFRMYAGPIPSFETWVRKKLAQEVIGPGHPAYIASIDG